jgi:thymidylate synthase (FAD)
MPMAPQKMMSTLSFQVSINMVISDIKVDLIDKMGSDLSVVNAARVSFNKVSTQCDDKDVKLINYLARHNHWTPFAHAFLSFRIKAPIFVARQAVKHQVGLAWNEVSRRYVDSEPEFWFPKEWRGRPQNMKQGSSGVVTLDTEAYCCPEDQVALSLATYNGLLDQGVAPEQARMVLPQNTMTEWIWSGSLAAFCRVCKLRLDPHAQQEIQELAGGILAHLEACFPVSTKALLESE